MVKSNVSIKYEEDNFEPPDIFRAASNNDVDELRRALADGQSLDTHHLEFYRMTPMHIACVRKSADFLHEALSHEFNAWTRDANGRISMDHAIAQSMDDIADGLMKKLYPVGPDGKPVMPF